MEYKVTLTAAEDAALSYVANAQQDWIDNAIHERCRVAIEEVVQLAVQKCLANNVAIPGTKDEIVALAFEQGWAVPAAQRQNTVLVNN
jgi:hypothetical protein